MANLVVRNLDDALVRKLKQRASHNGRSAEAEHRAILEDVLAVTKRRLLIDVLAEMPDVGRDEYFERYQGNDKDVENVFD
jgi:plasmid stability protein